MIQPNSKRKTRSDKFLLTLHRTGQFCKKINGKLASETIAQAYRAAREKDKEANSRYQQRILENKNNTQ